MLSVTPVPYRFGQRSPQQMGLGQRIHFAIDDKDLLPAVNAYGRFRQHAFGERP